MPAEREESMNDERRSPKRPQPPNARPRPTAGRATLLALLVLAWAAPAAAIPIEAQVGAGPDLATIVLEFSDGAQYAFEVLFDEAVATSGIDVMQTLEAGVPGFSLSLLDYGFGLFVDGIGYDGHADAGYGGGEDFWHYWTRESADQAWLSSQVGAADRLLADGAWDGWVYGTATAPLPEPGTGALVAWGLLAVARRPRRAQSRVPSASPRVA